MAGNSIGQLFRVTTCGESHGVGLMAIVDGVPPGLELSAEDLQIDLDRRKPGTSKLATHRFQAETSINLKLFFHVHAQYLDVFPSQKTIENYF